MEHILDDAVLKRVVADHADAPAGVRPADGSFQAAFQNVELAVHLDAQGLERALGRVSAGAARACRDGRLDDVDQLRARFKRGLLAGADDEVRDAAGPPLIGVGADDPSEVCCVVGVHDLCCG